MGVVWPALTPQGKDRPGNVRERCRMDESSCGCCTRSLNIGFGSFYLSASSAPSQ